MSKMQEDVERLIREGLTKEKIYEELSPLYKDTHSLATVRPLF